MKMPSLVDTLPLQREHFERLLSQEQPPSLRGLTPAPEHLLAPDDHDGDNKDHDGEDGDDNDDHDAEDDQGP